MIIRSVVITEEGKKSDALQINDNCSQYFVLLE